MSPIAMTFGVLLILLSGHLYFQSPAPTALIPAYFGVALVLLGIVARNEKFRMLAMHIAALVAFFGFAVPAFMVIKGLAIDRREFEFSLQGQAAMAGLCLVFLGLCVKSFIDSRAARKRREAEAQMPGK